MLCLKCTQPTKNPKYCSRSCAASMNNHIHQKRELQGSCLHCHKPIKKSRKYCKDCSPKLRGDITIQEAIYLNHHKSSAYALIRTRARAIAKQHNMNTCIECGYSKHVEIAHIQPIGSFPLDTMVSVINALDNLKPLCPNCHWEFDHKHPRSESN